MLNKIKIIQTIDSSQRGCKGGGWCWLLLITLLTLLQCKMVFFRMAENHHIYHYHPPLYTPPPPSLVKVILPSQEPGTSENLSATVLTKRQKVTETHDNDIINFIITM